MFKMLNLLLSSFLQKKIWKEAVKSFFYFFLLFICGFFLSLKGVSYFGGSVVEQYIGSILSEVAMVVLSLVLSIISSYLILMFLRDGYFYEVVQEALEIGKVQSGGLALQIKSLLRVVFLLFATIFGVLVSFVFPILGALIMCFCLSLEIFSYVFEVEKVGILGSMKFVSNNLLAVMLLGGFCFFLSLIPGLGLISYPAAIRAGALYFKELRTNP